MKKILLIISILYMPLWIHAQFTGAGTLSNPYNGGTLTGNQTWLLSNSPIFVSGDLTVGTSSSAGHLTIEAGVVVAFCATGADLIITGLGQLTTVGTQANMIRFTADNNKNGTYGETGETWGHLSFQSMSAAGTSNIEYCIFEYGKIIASGNFNDIKPVYYGNGGAIYADYSDLIIRNCVFRYNYAYFGGAIYVNGTNPHISNCTFISNIARECGGAMSFFSGSGALVENCIFQNNHSIGFTYNFYSGGAIFFGPGNGSSTSIVNSTFVNNTSDRPGDAIYFYSSVNYLVKNCILWGSSNQVFNSGSSLINCAIQGSVPGGAINCISINASNTGLNPSGPFFNNPAGLDWSIQFLSPCRDAGTTPSPAIPSDIIGNPRIGPYDIGAYEVQYNRWKTTATSTDWATPGNWDQGVPTSSQDVVIPTGATNYPTGSSSQNFTVGSGKMLLLNSGAKVTLGTLTNDGTLKLESDATNISSLIVSSFSGNAATIELFLTGGNPGVKLFKWHFISTPVSSLPVSTFAPTFTKNVVGWYDNQVSGTLATGWIAYNGFRYSTSVIDGPTFLDLTPGNGYDFYAATDLKYTFSGQLNTSNVPMSLSFFGVNDALYGFNLLGNPFSSGLNWDDIINNVYFPYPALTSKSLYFTRDNAQCSYVSGVGIPSDVTGIIPPMQGFFVKTYGAGNTITIPAGARVQGSIHARYKGDVIIPLVRLSLAEGTLTDETVVRFDAAAKSGLDYDFDAPKMFLSPDILSIYSTSAGSNLAINGLPFPDPSVDVPIVINLTATGTHTISATQLQGLDNYNVTLTDNTTGFIADLKATPVLTFSAATGTLADRFILKVGTIATGIENPVVSKNTFNIYPANNMINIQTISDAWDGKSGSVKVLDLTGKTVSDLNNSEFSKNSLIQVASPGAKGIYIVEIKSGFMRYVGKVVIR